MKPVHARPIDAFRNGKWRVMIVTEAGSITATTKDGDTVDLPYRSGDALLGTDRDEVICGPVGPQGALDLAERILDGNQRATTDPLALLALATAIVAFGRPEADEPPRPSQPDPDAWRK